MRGASSLGIPLVLLFSGVVLAQEWVDVYPGAVDTSLARGLILEEEVAPGSFFITTRPVRDVGRFYLERWRAEGLPVFAHAEEDGALTISAFRTREGLCLSVVLRKVGERTLGFRVERRIRGAADLRMQSANPPRG